MSLISTLVIFLRGDTSSLDASLDKSTKKLSEFGSRVGNLGGIVAGGIGGLGGQVGGVLALVGGKAFATAAAISSISAALRSAGEQADVIKKISREASILGISTTRLAGLVSQTGVDPETMTHALQHLNRSLGELELHGDKAARGLGALTAEQKHATAVAGPAAEANSRQETALERLGLSYEKLKRLSPMEQQAAIADGWKRLKSETEEAAVATALFGRVGQELIPVLRQGREGLEKLDQATIANNLDFDHGADAVRRSASAWKQMNLAITGISRQLAIALAPAWEMFAEAMTGTWRGVGRFVRDSIPLFNQFWSTTRAGFSLVNEVARAFGNVCVTTLNGISDGLGTSLSNWQTWSKGIMDTLLAMEFTFTKWGATWNIIVDTVALKLAQWMEDVKAAGRAIKELFEAMASGNFERVLGTLNTPQRNKTDLEKELEAQLRADQRIFEKQFEQFLAEKMAQFKRNTDAIQKKNLDDIKQTEKLEAAERGSAAAFSIINQTQGNKMFNVLNQQLQENKKMADELRRIGQILANGKPIVVGRV